MQGINVHGCSRSKIAQMQGAEERAAEHTFFMYVSSAATKATQQMGIFQREPSKGFTLIELIMVIILIGIVAATAVSIIGNIINQQRFDETVKEMNELKMAMLGNPDLVQSGTRTSFGYVGDIGALPTSLNNLVSQGGLPSWTKTSTYDSSVADLGTGAGWLAPSYIDAKKDDSGNFLALLDGWGNAYSYNNATAQVTSTGGGSGSITIPETSQAAVLAGGVTGTVKGNQGNPVQGATVTIYYPNGSGVHTTFTSMTDANGIYSFSNIPIGKRTIKVVSGSLTISDAVAVDGGQILIKNFVIADMVAPVPPAGLNITRASYSSLNLTWSPSSSADTAGYKIYRGTSPGGESLFKTGITATSYIDDNNGVGLVAGTTYYYTVSAVDSAGNESSPTAEANETANPIQVTSAAASWNGPHNTLTIRIRNNDVNANLTINTLIINATGCTTTCNDYVNRITICGGAPQTPTPNPAPNNTQFTISGAAINALQTCNMNIRFSNAGGSTSANYPASISIQMNPASFLGNFTKTGL